jgi:anaerobic magnesium-protoporphyrin IX monomethyl ester cyclase
MKKKCLLITSPTAGNVFPRGIVEIASFLENKGCSTAVLPLAYYLGGRTNTESKSDQEKRTVLILMKFIEEMRPIVVGVSNQFTCQYFDCLKILEICKKINNKIITVMGGPHVTFLDLECIKSPAIDVIVRGEGEWTMLDLLSTAAHNKDLGTVKGITFKKKGGIFVTPPRPLGDLKALPPINFELLPKEFIQKSLIYGTLNRGCLYNCKFCAESKFWIKRRVFPIHRLIREMRVLGAVYNNRMACMEDSMLSIGSKQFFEMCSELTNHKIDIPSNFYIQSRVDTITEQGVRALKRANIRNVYLGIESASAKVLKAMNKNITEAQIIAACKKLKEQEISVHGFWMIGHPGDDPQEAAHSLKTFKYLFEKDLIQGAEVNVFLPYPGTPFFNEPKKYGIKILSYDWSRWERWCSKPMCQLKNFSAKEIGGFYNKMTSIARAYVMLRRIGFETKRSGLDIN